MENDPILHALEEYEAHPVRNSKKAVLLTPGGGYLICGNRYCGMTAYDLEVSGETLEITGSRIQHPLFFAVLPDCFLAAPILPESVSLIFHIDLGEGEPLRGILVSHEQEARLALFTNGEIEELYRLSRRMSVPLQIPAPPDEELQQYAEKLRQSDLRWLIGMYLRGSRLDASAREALLDTERKEKTV